MFQKFLFFVLLFLATSCATLKSVKPIIQTVDNVAQGMCAVFYGDKMAITKDQALKLFCEFRKDWADWIDPALYSIYRGGQLKLAAESPAAAAPLECPVVPLPPPPPEAVEPPPEAPAEAK